MKGRELEYKVNLKSQVVVQNNYDDGELFNPFYYNDCKVIDSSNFTCQNRFDNTKEGITMTDGRVSLKMGLHFCAK